MAGSTDFLALYQELGLAAECSVNDLKLAYRKRVGELHPDRVAEDAESMRGLQHLNVLYASAMDFHKRHGRLPGSQLAMPATRGAPVAPAPTAHAVRQRPARGNAGLVLGSLVVLIAIAAWAWSESPATSADTPVYPASNTVHAVASTHPASMPIDLGSPMQRVRELHGEPVSGWEQRWEYGPSWVAFRCGIVIDWYSSALRPLKVSSTEPVRPANWSMPKNCKG